MKKNYVLLAVILAVGLAPLLVGAVSFDEDDFKRARKEAEQGDPKAALALGMMYHSGEGTPQNYNEAVNWYRRAADQGNLIAQNSLGVMYLNGHGVRENPAEAVRWIRAAANQGNPRAQINLGHLFARGKGVPRNFNEASRWYHRAAEQGDAEAQVNLGQLYAEGQQVPRNLVVACKWFLLAAAQGDSDGISERDDLTPKLTMTQLTEAQRLAAAFTPRRDPAATGTPKASGTGFIVTTDGHVLTAYHVVEEATDIIVHTRKLKFAARLVKADKTNDIALLKIIGAFAPTPTNATTLLATGTRLNRPTSKGPLLGVTSNFRPLTVATKDGAKLGDAVSTLGFPNIQIQGREPKFTRGEINSLAGIKDDARYFQISAPVQPGNSGGPLLDGSGQVIGMVLSRLNDLTLLKATGSVPQNVNYALKSSRLLTLLKSLPAVSTPAPNAAGETKVETGDWLGAAHDSILLIEVF